ncbi:ABC transporter substrate-binding protein [Rhodoferax koreense]|uniref:ABC transporter substrate-binding protein n=1 Tax=Rhodoferax koreensis TaxID=1842727 RepID=A0A1P8K256_9BURK|nr:tripartite tricarboxylate transporter substrate binding protein [Rhodoferax koreense]APW40080.1 ABC transporter substrate-binding protein [Rhodoferax koreense]
MRLSSLSIQAALAAVTFLAGPCANAQAPAWPTRPITIVVGYPPGGSTDLTGRSVALELSTRLGVPVVIENIGGAGGAIGAQKVANAAPDGYTLLVGASNEVAISRLVTPATKYDIKDFTPIGLIASQPLVLVASTGSGVKTVAQFIDLVKRNPGKYSYGSSGVGTSLHLAGEMIKQQAGVFMTHIPYRGVAPLTNDLLGNNLDFGVFVLSSGLPHIKSGKVVALGTTEAKRSAVTPDIPALAETPQLKGMDIGVWFALLGPAKLPEPIAAKLRKALDETLQSPDFRKKMEASSSTVAAGSGGKPDVARFLQDEVAKYKKIVEFANIKE